MGKTKYLRNISKRLQGKKKCNNIDKKSIGQVVENTTANYTEVS